jgi:hypothetical protein
MDFFTNASLSLAIGIGAITGWIRFRKVDPAFHPFIYLVSAGFLHEVWSIALLCNGYSNVLLFNCYLLAEALLLCWQFHRWDIIARKGAFVFLQVILTSWWAVEWLFTPPQSFSSYFIIFYSVAAVLLSITCINRLLFREAGPLLRNPIFLLCACFILYFGFSALTEIFWMTDLKNSKAFRIRIHALLSYVNLFTNLVYAIAIIWMPTRFHYIMRL